MLALFLSACASKAPQKVGQCQLTVEQAQTLAEIKRMNTDITKKSEQFDRELAKGPVDLYSNDNYQAILRLKYERDEALNYLTKSLTGNSLCLETLFKKDLNFPELVDEK